MDLPKTQYRIRKDVDLRALKIDDSFIIINDRYFLECLSQPIVSKFEISSCSATNFADMSNFASV